MTDDLRLGSEFLPATREDWLKLVRGAPKERPYERLIAKSYDGLPIEPLYGRAASAQPIAARRGPWRVMARVDHPDPQAANAQALEDLENGATGLVLVFAASVSANGYGLDASAATIARALEGIHLDAGITIDFNLSPPTRAAVQHFASMARAQKIAPTSVDMRASINPIGGFAASGTSPAPWNELSKRFAEMIGGLAAEGFRGPLAVADGRIIHNAGGSEAQELAFTIASATEYLRVLEQNGVAIDRARDMIYFRITADADQFLTMAKFRALRKLWARVEQACGIAPKPAYVSAETAWRMLTQRDAAVNMLRNTIAITAAALGGADAITVLPHTAALGLPDAFARRVARNSQLILLEESNLARVADPAAGSGAMEALTDELCAAAWSQLQEIEKTGGAWAAVEQGLVQREVARVRVEREKAAAHRKDPLTGTSEYPNLGEQAATVLNVAPVVSPKEPSTAITTEALPRIRLAAPFEALRDTSDRMLAKNSARPKIFLANLGTLAEFTARATFTRNFFEAGGIEAITSDGYKSHGDMIAAFKVSGAKLACLCSSDAVYEKEAADAAKALAAAGATHIYLAGRPKDADALKTASVGGFIYVGCDALAALRDAYAKIGRP